VGGWVGVGVGVGAVYKALAADVKVGCHNTDTKLALSELHSVTAPICFYPAPGPHRGSVFGVKPNALVQP